MALYEYTHKRPVTDCEMRFVVFQRMAEDAFSVCPDCGREVQRLISAPRAIVRKGSVPVKSLFAQKFGKEKNYVVPETKEVVRLKGPKSSWEGQAYAAQKKAQPNLKRSDFKLLT